MDTLKYMISFFLKIALVFFIMAFMWWVVSLFFPDLSFRTLMPLSKKEGGVVTKKDLLPSPRQYQGLFANKGATVNSNLYVPGAAYNGYASQGGVSGGNGYVYTNYDYVMYTATGSVRVDGSGKTVLSATKASSSVPTALTPNASIPNRTLYVRNLSIYEGGHIYTGLSFIGEARSTMFRQGKFPIVMVDAYGKVVGVSTAVAENDWTVPGWVRFNTKIEYVLPKNMPCTMVFEEAQFPDERAKKAPTRVPLATRCN